MPSERHQRVSKIFLEARRLESTERERCLADHCAGDRALKKDVEALLASEPLADEYFSPPAPNAPSPDAHWPPLVPGEMIGDFRLVEVIGHGGMGVVWKAEDTSLGREVALKFLATSPSAVDWEGRFTEEAKMLGSLKHPGIATAYGLHRASGRLFLSMEMIRGETLAHRLRKGRLPVPAALRVAWDIATALEEAHSYGINHMDIKPGNIMLEKPKDKVKILDFGLAGASVKNSAGGEGVISAADGTLPPAGLVGTGPYMSPEQLTGRPLGRAVDIWAFGCVLYEMLAGSRAFGHRTLTQTVAAIRRSEPNWHTLPPVLPAGVEELLRHCLQKDPADRPAHMRQAREILEGALRLSPAVPAPAPHLRWWLRWGAQSTGWAIGLTITAGILGFMWRGAALPDTGNLQVSHSVVHSLAMPAGDGRARIGAISPDGSHVVLLQEGPEGKSHLVLRELPRGVDELLPGTESAVSPFFSPDGQAVGFFQNGGLMKVSIAGGPLIRLATTIGGRGASWGDDGFITFTPNLRTGLARIPAEGGIPEALTTLNGDRGEITHRWPHMLPGGHAVLFTVGHRSIDSFDDASVAVQDLDTGTSRILLSGGMQPRFVPPDHLIFARDGRLFAVGFDPDSLQLHGSPRVVLDAVLSNPSTGQAFYALASESGDLIYSVGSVLPGDLVLEWYSPSGREDDQVLGLGPFGFFSLSGDGKRLAITLNRYYDELWVYDLPHGTRARLTDGPSEGRRSCWTPDGSRVAYADNRQGNEDIWWRRADGTGRSEILVNGPHREFPSSWHPDGQTLAYVEINPTTGIDIHLLHLGDEPVSKSFRVTGSNELAPRFAPDGTLIAYLSDETGRLEAYVETYPQRNRRIQVSSSGAASLRWNGTGDRLYFVTLPTHGNRVLMAASVTRRPELSFSAAEAVIEGPFQSVFEVDPVHDRFLMSRYPRKQSTPNRSWLIHRWSGGLPGR